MIKNDEIQKKIDIEDENITLGDIASHGKFWLPKKKVFKFFFNVLFYIFY